MLLPTLIFHLIGLSFSQNTKTKLGKELKLTGENSPISTIINRLDGDKQVCDDCEPNPDEFLTAPQIIERQGYVSESHVVETTDGFLLTLHRIPVSKSGKIGKQPVFLQHGLLSCSADWVFFPNQSLAFMLSDFGYDVWLGNARGNRYSKAHVSLSPNSAEFWNFTFHEMGVYDLPAILSHVSNITGKGNDIIYIGHSMGATMFYVFASTFPKFANNTIKIMVGLAPVAYTAHIRSPIRYLAPWVNDMEWLAKYFGIMEFLPNGIITKYLSHRCELYEVDKRICEQVLFMICGFDMDQLETKNIPVLLAHSSGGTSSKTIIHYTQEAHHRGDFMQFDYRQAGNLIQYGTPKPPLYNLSNINVPTYFMYGENDWLADPSDVHRLAQEVSRNVGLYDIPLKSFNHIDFMWAKDAPKLVYEKLIQVIQKYPAN